MKKILTIALVALLAVSTAFAGLSGKAILSLGYDTKSKTYGFTNDSSFTVDLDLASTEAGEVPEGDVVAGAKASLTVKVANRRFNYDVTASEGKISYGENYTNNAPVYNDGASLGLGAFVSLDEAYVKGADWKLSITGTQSGPDFAKSALDKAPITDKWTTDAFGNLVANPDYYSEKAKTYSVSVNKAPGFVAEYKDWKVGLGFEGGKADEEKKTPDYFNYHVSLFTPSFELAEGFTLKAAAVASGLKNKTGKDYYYDDWGNAVLVIPGSDVYAPKKNYDAFGASVEGAYSSDAFSGKLAVDFGMKKTKENDAKFVPGLDVAANAVVSLATVDAYYQFGKDGDKNVHYLSAQVAADLNTFEVPVVVKAYGKDITDGKTFGGEVSGTIDAITLTAGGSYTIKKKSIGVSGSVEYKAEKFTAKAGANFSKTVDKDDQKLYANASVESDALVPGATLKLAYGPNKEAKADNTGYNTTTNFLDSSADKGAVTASCTIKF